MKIIIIIEQIEIKQHMRENLTAQICLKGLDAQKFSCAKISTFKVIANHEFTVGQGLGEGKTVRN